MTDEGHALRRRARHRLRTYVSEMPAIYLPFARRKYPGPSPQVISATTQVVIDGYTRSATTYAVYAFQLAQPVPVPMAHHLHAPAQLIRAAQLGIPTLALIREPRGAVLSQLVREPDVTLADALVAYARFYRRLLPYRSEFVVADFDDVTKDFASVVRRLNLRFGTSFAEFDATNGKLDLLFDLVARRPTLFPPLLEFESGLVTLDRLQDLLTTAPATELTTEPDAWLPSAERTRRKETLHRDWSAPSLQRPREAALLAYRQFAVGASSAATVG